MTKATEKIRACRDWLDNHTPRHPLYEDIQQIMLTYTTDKQDDPRIAMHAVCTYYGFTSDEITGTSRKGNLPKARHTLAHILHNVLNYNLTETGRLIGYRDHSTIINSLKKYDNYRFSDTGFRNLADTIIEDVMEAINKKYSSETQSVTEQE